MRLEWGELESCVFEYFVGEKWVDLIDIKTLNILKLWGIYLFIACIC